MKKVLPILLAVLLLFSGCKKIIDEIVKPDPTKIKVSDFASGFVSAIGLAVDDKGQVWVTQNGTGANDGKISVISKNGVVQDAIVGFNSIISPEDGLPAGLTHLYYKGGRLYILHGVQGRLYIAKTSDFKAGKPIQAAALEWEDIGTFVLSKELTDPLNTNIFNLCFGPREDLYIVDAGANAIIKRNSSNKQLSVFARIPEPQPGVDAVPTGIVYDGHRFLISALSGFPFTEGAASISQIDQRGKVSYYKKGFSLLTDIALTDFKRPLVLQFSRFENFGFLPNAGRLLEENGNVLLNGLMMPTSIVQANQNTYYILNMASGVVQKLSYQ